MKRYLLLFILLVSACALAYAYAWAGFLLLGVMGLALVGLLAAGLVKAIKKNVSPRWWQVPLAVMAIGAMAIGISLLRPLAPAVVYTEDVSQALAYAYQTDQEDRFTLKCYLGNWGSGTSAGLSWCSGSTQRTRC